MNAKNLMVISLVLAALALAGCGGGGDSRDLTIAPFIGGSEALAISTLDGGPPPTVTDGGTSNFAVIVNLENVGESNVGPGTENPFVLVRLAGIQPQNWGFSEEDRFVLLDRSIQGARKNFDGTILPGGVDTVNFQPLNFQHKVPGSQVFTFRAEVCYDYSTHSTTKVCIKDDILEHLQDDTLCRLRDDLVPKNSGAPVHVVEADQSPIGDDRIQVNFVLKNIGDGVPFNRADDSKKGACDFDIHSKGIYKVLVVVSPVDPQNYGLDCRGLDDEKPGFENVGIKPGAEYGIVRLRQNAPRSLTCFLERETSFEKGRVFQDLMDVDIYYRYGEFLDIPILVQNSRTADLSRKPPKS